MDYTPNVPNIPTLSANNPHHKFKWIIIFIACLIILVAVVTLIKVVNEQSQETTNPEQELINAMTATGPSQVNELEAKAIIDASTARPDNALKPLSSEQVKLLDAMTSKN